MHVKRGLIRSLYNRASTICQDLFNEISSLRCDFQLSAYPQGFMHSVINSMGSSRSKKAERSLSSVYIPYAKGVSLKFKVVVNYNNIRSIFKTKLTVRSSLTKTRPERDPLQTAQCFCSTRYECGRSYIGVRGRPLVVRFREHRHNLKEGLLEKSKLARHAYEEGHRVGWDKARI
jgi:hypothetical protein